MKKGSVIILICSLLICLSGFAACDKKPNEKHTHTFESTVVEPTCEEDGFTLYVCLCTETKKDNVVPALGHDYVNDVCTRCGKSLYSKNLSYTVNEDGETCTLIGIGDCTDKELVIPSVIDGYLVTAIAENSFSYLKEIVSVSIPFSVVSIGEFAFFSCPKVAKITVDERNVFYKSVDNCLIEIQSKKLLFGCVNSVIPSDGSVKIIGKGAFGYYDTLMSIVIPEGVTVIEEGAFIGCAALKDVVLPNSVREIGYAAFSYCESIVGTYVIPDSVQTIGEQAFYDCEGVEKIIIGNGVTAIEMSTFECCYALKEVVIGSKVTSIGEAAFNECYSLETIKFPNGLTKIGKYAFESCEKITNLILPNSAEIHNLHPTNNYGVLC